MKKLLIIDDDFDLVTVLASSLSQLYQVTTAGSLEAAYTYLETQHFDLAIVDRILPDGDGQEIISYLESVSYQTKVLAVSQLSQVQDKISTLEQGADDYLVKPFSLAELKIKVDKSFHYDKRKDSTLLSLCELQFNPETGEVKIPGAEIQLRRKEALILSCLLRYKNRVVSRETIIDEVWAASDVIPTQTTLDVYIRRIRILLKTYGSRIQTRRGFGYIFSDA